MVSLEHRLDVLERRLHEFSADLQLIQALVERDPHATLNKVRYIAEGVLFRLCRDHAVTWGKGEPTLENMIGPLIAAGHVPKTIGIHFKTIQANASPGSHYQDKPLGAGHVHIALLALVDVLEWVVGEAPTALPAARRWSARVVHPLQPARHFAGRAATLARLRAWWRDPDPRERVVSLVAVGGAGKTALVEQLLAEPAPAGVFVWSFYEDQRTEALLGEALAYLGVRDADVGGRLERLRVALAGARDSHTFVFDGLEAIQSLGGDGKLRGKIEDASIRLLLRSIAAGLGTTRALVTSRSKLVDLEDWAERGYARIALDELDREATRAVLRGWGVRGSDAELEVLHDQVGGHALSIAVLGSYLAGFCDGDPTRASDLPLAAVAEEDPLAARLARVLDRYASALPADERDLLTRLAAFPRGATVEVLGFLARAPAVAGSLAGRDTAALKALLDHLVRRGLVYATRSGTGASYSAHPFLRQHLKRLLGIEPAQLHETVRAGLAPGLAGAPRTAIGDPALLDRYEQLIEHTRLAGLSHDALLLFQRVLGGYTSLGSLGEYARGWRIASGLLEDPRTGRTDDDAPEDRAALFTHAGLFAQALGDAGGARRLFECAVPSCRSRRQSNWIHAAQENLGDLERLAGRLPRAVEIFRLELEFRAKNPLLNALAGHAFQLAGLPDDAARCLAASNRPDPDPLLAFHRGAQLLNVSTSAVTLATVGHHFANGLARAVADSLQLDAARCRYGLGLVGLATGTGDPPEQLALARDWALRSGHVEMLVLCDRLAAAIDLARGDRAGAARHATHGMQVAESAGFELLAIDLLVLAARAAADERERLARGALVRAETCGYAWAAVDAGLLVGDFDPAAAAAARALAGRIGHPL